jgi:hypothetical protein
MAAVHDRAVPEQLDRAPSGGDTLVLLVTAWHDEEGVRARMVHNLTGTTRQAVAGSTPDLIDAIRAVLNKWEDSCRQQAE